MQAETQRTVAQYLTRYAEEDARRLAAAPPIASFANCNKVLVLPCYAEATDCLSRVLAHIPDAELQRLLLIVVVNAPVNAPTSQRQQTQALLAKLTHQLANPQTLSPHLVTGDWYEPATSKHQLQRQARLLLVDRCTDQSLHLPRNQGVGLARKIGADLALAWMQPTMATDSAANLGTKRWIYTTDADAVLPHDYFSRALPNAAALCLPFSHHSDNPELLQLARTYEIHMQTYVDGLASARSPYAYHSMGSATVINPLNYAQVRGFPKRSAGEDFHLLNKLAKTGAIVTAPGRPIQLAARLSSRVPFGTGPALAKLRAQQTGFTTYPDQAFQLLGEALRGTIARCQANQLEQQAAQHIDQHIDQHIALSKNCAQLLTQIDPKRQINALLASSPNPAQRINALHHWFDALKTLQFVRLASQLYPPKRIPPEAISAGDPD